MRRALIAVALIALMIAPTLAPIAAAKDSIELEVTTEYINYNLVVLRIKNLPSTTPPAVKAVLYDADGNPVSATDRQPLLLIAGYSGNNEWTVIIALNKTFKSNLFTSSYANTSATTIGTADRIYTMNDVGTTDGRLSYYLGVSLAKPSQVPLVSPYTLAIDGKAVENITKLSNGTRTDINITRANITKAWPLANAICADGVAEIEVKVEAGDYGTGSVTLTVGSAGFKARIEGYKNAAPEKKISNVIDAPTIAADPTTVASLTRKLVNGTSDINVTALIVDQTATSDETQIFYSKNLTLAQKVALLEAGAASPSLNIYANLTRGTNWTALNITADSIPQNATVYIKLKANISIYINGSKVYEANDKVLYTVLDSSRTQRFIFNITGLEFDSANDKVYVNISCIKVTVLPANVTVNINTLTGDLDYTEPLVKGKNINITMYTNARDYMFVEDSSGAVSTGFNTVFRMPGRDDIPSYNAVRERYAVNDAPVTINFKDVNAAESQVVAFVKLQTGVLTVNDVKPGQKLTITLEDIDAASAPVTIELLNANGNRIAGPATLTLEPVEGQEGKFQASLAVVIGNPDINTDEKRICVDNTVAAIRVNYTDKYGAGGSEVLRTAKSTVSFWPVTFDAPAETYKGARVDLVLQSNNFNMDPGSPEVITLQNTGTGAEVYYRNVKVGEITLEVYDHLGRDLRNIGDTGDIFIVRTFFEEGNNTGKYVIYMYTRGFAQLGDGYTIKVRYHDVLNNETYEKSIVVKTFLGKINVTHGDVKIESLPLPFSGDRDYNLVRITKTYTITIDDPDANQNVSEIENVPITVIVTLQDGDDSNRITVNLAETDVSTGVFTGTLNITTNSSGMYLIVNGSTSDAIWLPADQWPLSTITIRYYDASRGTTVTYTIETRLTASAELTIEPAEVPNANANVTITLNEPDLDLVPGAENDELPGTVAFYYSYLGGSGSFTVADLAARGYTFKEVEPGVFQVTVPARVLLNLTVGSVQEGLGKSITLTYYDPAGVGSTQGSLVKVKTKASFLVRSYTGELTITPERTHPYGVLTVVLNDPDLAGLTYNDIRNLLQASSGNASLVLDLLWPPEEDVPSENGTFKFQIELNGRVLLPKDRVAVMYLDRNPAPGEGEEKAVIATAEVVTDTASFDIPAEVGLGNLEVVLKDFDSNTDPFKRDTVRIQVWSDDSPVVKTITLVETDVNSGVFKNIIRLTDNEAEALDATAVLVKPGSKVYFAYTDPLTADGRTNVRITAEAVVKAELTVKRPLRPEVQQARLVDPVTKQQVAVVKPGKQVFVEVPIVNLAEQIVSFNYIVTVYKDGVPVAFFAAPAAVGPGAATAVFTLPPLPEPGTYEVEIVLVNNLTEYQVLSKEPITLTITVSE